ncbi:MAG: alpha-1,4-glucan--maltose-1-phosphate maltosyltransferase [Anaerolineaceae bacterium]
MSDAQEFPVSTPLSAEAVQADTPQWSRVVIGSLQPEVEGGRFPAKRCLGDAVTVRAQVVADGHDVLGGVVRFRPIGETPWRETELRRTNPGLDIWSGDFTVDRLGGWEFSMMAWVDPYRTWLSGLRAKAAAGQELGVALEQGALLIETATMSADLNDRLAMQSAANALRLASAEDFEGICSQTALVLLVAAHTVRRFSCESPIRRINVDPVLARFSAWYEFFPRSTGADGAHGTFKTSLPRLKQAAEMGFDVVYLPPIHPIGRTNRKGPNNSVGASPGDPGSPWAIGSSEGGHRSIHPQLGTLGEFREFVSEARRLNVEVALDLAFQCAPDHPLVTEHPEWFRRLPDGSIAYAENPPKRYEDIVPFDFECDDWAGLWEELLETTLHWVELGIRVFRVDNPHTKPLAFWEWLIARVYARYPEVVFLAEAFARPALLHGLAQRGFSQSYTYFAWRNTHDEIVTYLTELIHGPGREYLRPNLWPNTPDILPEYLQAGGRPAAIVRLVLAATLSASYGIYGPPFEVGEATALRPGSEEYRDSEKYQMRSWNTSSPWSLGSVITRVNTIRRESAALHQNETLLFHPTTNEWLLCYSKHTPGGDDLIVVVVNLDPHHIQAGVLKLDEEALSVSFSGQYLAADLLAGGSYVWQGRENYVELDPAVTPAHIFELRRQRRTERDFDYFF